MRKRSASRSSGSLIQIKVALKGARPPLWRRLIVRGDTKLDQLHAVIQTAMGWMNCHMHQFIVGSGRDRAFIGEANPELGDWGSEMLDETGYVVADILDAPKRKVVYEYDFGDNWLHDITLEKILPPDAECATPECVAGKRACPQEDCGGVYGYSRLVEILADPEHPEHEETQDWVGDDWDPERFDVAAVNRRLKQLKI